MYISAMLALIDHYHRGLWVTWATPEYLDLQESKVQRGQVEAKDRLARKVSVE